MVWGRSEERKQLCLNKDKGNVPIKQKERRPKRRFVYVVQDDVKVIKLMKENGMDREKQKTITCCGNLSKETAKKKFYDKLQTKFQKKQLTFCLLCLHHQI